MGSHRRWKNSASSAQFDFATALRCIGQDLELRGLKTFDIHFDGQEYVAQCGYQEPPAPTPVNLTYTPADLLELDQAGDKKRSAASTATDFLNQVQVFRTIGGYLDKNQSRFLRMTNNDSARKDSTFKVEYVNDQGETVVDDRAGAAIYDMCVAMYKQRGKLTGTGAKLGARRR